MKEPTAGDSDFHLKFIEGFHELTPRRCTRVKRIAFGQHNNGLLVRISPAYPAGTFRASGKTNDLLLLSPHFQCDSLFPVNEWPLDVYVYFPMVDGVESRDRLEQNEILKIAFGMIYRDRDDAPIANDC